MRLELKAKHYLGIGVALAIVLTDFVFLFSFAPGMIGPKKWFFAPIFVVGIFLGALPFFQDFLAEKKRQKELETKFLEFVRNLGEIVRSGVSIPQAIIQVRQAGANYGALTPYIEKLANQIEWGYPLNDALTIFAKDTKNVVIRRSVGIVIQAEKSGGDLAAVLGAVSGSVLEIKKLKDEQKSQAYGQMIQGYIIFFVFIGIMIVMQVYLIPKLSEISGEVVAGLSASFAGSGAGEKTDLTSVFLGTIVVQGLFAGLMLGKFSEGSFTAGVKHAVIMILGGYLLMTTISGLLGAGSSAVTTGTAVAVALLVRRQWAR